jgi:hypothetical protein
MNNFINRRQNEESSIVMLAAQRQLYICAKVLNKVEILFSVIIPFILSFLILIETSLILVASVSSLFSMFISFIVGDLIEKKKNLAAEIQQQFDVYVFQMPWNKRLFGNKKNMSEDIAKYSKKILSKSEQKIKLVNWYTDVADKVELSKGILTCQKESYCWDKNLRNRYKNYNIVTIAVIVAIVFGIGIVRKEIVDILLWRLAFVAPMLQWLLKVIKNLGEDIHRLEYLGEEINSSTEKDMSELQDIQHRIFEHRKSCYIISDWFYNAYKDTDEDMAHRIAETDIEAEKLDGC